MGSADYSGCVPENALSELLKIASAELRDLHAHYDTITRRIRTLRAAVDALRKLESRSLATESPVPEPSPSRQSGERFAATGLQPQSADTPPVASGADVARRRNLDLRRACRIALLETAGAASCQEVHRRIVRRGSFCFPNADTATSLIMEELNALAELGEVRRCGSRDGQSWQRILPQPDPGDPPVS
jgi:hypothetical protein